MSRLNRLGPRRMPLGPAIITVLTLALFGGPACTEADLRSTAALVADVEAAELGDANVKIPDDLDGELDAASNRVDRYLEGHPDDVAALILVARLARLRSALQPISFAPAQGEGPPKPDFGRAHGALARALELSPDDPEAHYWQARLYGTGWPTPVEGKLQYRAANLDLAIEHARRAAALAPTNRKYHEALTLYLLQDQRFDAALRAIRAIDQGRHPIALLLADLSALPLPAEAVYLPDESRNFAEHILQRGRITDYPNVRVRAYVIPLTATEIEGFYRSRWPDFRLIHAHDLFSQVFEFTNGVAKPVARTAEDLPGVPSSGVAFTLNELKNAPDQLKTRFSTAATDFSVLYLVNFRKSAGVGR